MDFSLTTFRRHLHRAYNALSHREHIILWCAIIVCIITGIFLLIQNINRGTVAIPAVGGTLYEGVVGPPRFINPLLAQTDTDLDLTTLVYSGLMRKVDEGVYIPDLAASYSISDNGKEYTLTIRDDARFHDGKPLTVDDVIFSVTQALNPNIKSPRGINWQGVHVEKKDDHTVIFTLSQPFAGFMDTLTMGILPKHIWSSSIDTDSFIYNVANTEPIGSGPYRVTQIKKKSDGTPTRYTLHRFRRFTLGRAYIPHIQFSFFDTPKDLMQSLQNHHSSSAVIDPADIGDEPRSTVITSIPLTKNFGLFFNVGKSKNPLVTKEGSIFIEHMLDKNLLVENVMHGYATPLAGPLPLSISSSSESSSTYNPDAARNFISTHGWTYDSASGILRTSSDPNSPAVSLTIVTGNAPHLLATAEHIRQQLARFGIVVTITPYDNDLLTQSVIAERKFDVLLFGQSFQHDTGLYAFWHSSQRTFPGLNIIQYANSATDSLLERALGTQGQEDRYALYQQFGDTIMRDHPVTYLYAPHMVYLQPAQLHTAISPVITSPHDRWNNVYHWYLRKERVWRSLIQETE